MRRSWSFLPRFQVLDVPFIFCLIDPHCELDSFRIAILQIIQLRIINNGAHVFHGECR